MKRTALIAMLFLIFTSFVYLDAQWARTYGGNDNELAYSFQQTSDGGYIVAGQTKTYGVYAPTGYDVWILKLDPNGDVEWQRTYGEGAGDYAYSIQQTSDGGYIVAGNTTSFGAVGGDLWVLKLSSVGDVEWQRTYGGGGGDGANSIQQTNDNGYIVAGSTGSFGSGSGDFWVLKLYSNGDIEWQKTYGGSDSDQAYSVQQTNDGKYIVAGHTYSFGAGNADVWILKLNSNGTIEWQRTYGVVEGSEANSIKQTIDGGYIVAGSYTDVSSGFWVLKLYSNGDIEWQKTYVGGMGAYSVQQTSDGAYIVAGETSAFGAGSYDFWVLRLYSNGDIEWQRTYGWNELDSAQCILQTSDGSYVVAGYTKSFGAGGPYDFLVFKLYSDGDIDQSCGFIGSSSASVVDTAVSPADTAVSPADTAVSPADTICLTQDSYSTANLFCEAPKYTLAISSTDKGTAAVINSSIDPAPGPYTYYDRTEVQIEAIPDVGYGLLYWSGDVPSGHENDNPLTITMDSDKSIRAHFRYTLTISAGIGGTTDPSPGNYYYDFGTAVTITAIADNGYSFENWSGDVSSIENPVEIIMDGDKAITANFIRQYTLTISAGSGGTTNPSPGSYVHDIGTQVSISAVPSSGYQFSGWGGDASGTTYSITITMDADKSVSASFTQTTTGDGDGDSGGGGCFIATAAYGSPLHPHVKILRDFRNKYLMPNKHGRNFVDVYYKYSPSAANIIARSKPLKVLVRIHLIPIIVLSYSMVHLGPIVTGGILLVILLLPIFFMSNLRKK